MLNVKRDLIGKTITGIIAAPAPVDARRGNRKEGPAEVWMMQFSDGTHVEFVSPGARRGLNRWTGAGSCAKRNEDPQMMLNVA